MISSMTGFGRGSAQTPTRRIKVEIKSLNSKQLDLSLRVPVGYREMEVALRTPVSAVLERGKVELTASVEALTASAAATVNVDLLESYKRQIEDAGARLGLPAPSDWYAILLRMPESLKTDTGEASDEDKVAMDQACREALDLSLIHI